MSLLPIGQTQAQDPASASTGPVSSVIDRALDIIDPSRARLAIAGLLTGGTQKQQPNVGFNYAGNTARNSEDWRVRVSLADSANYFYAGADKGVMAPLFKGSSNQNGVIFPYAPQVQVQYSARYGSARLTHSNYDAYFYEGSEVQAINISGDFTVQNIAEGRYLLAAIYFFRAATKMWYGQSNTGHMGNPPPMVFLDGYGEHYFPHVPCVVTQFSHTMPPDCDYLEITPQVQTPSNGYQCTTGPMTFAKSTRLPTTSQVSISLQPIYSRKSLYNKFNLDDFAAGKLVKGNGGFI